MNIAKSNLNEFLTTNRTQFIIPTYQRNYAWDKAQCQKLLEDILAVANGQKQKHFVGTITYITHDCADKLECVVIDGQQRLTTTTLLLKAIQKLSNNEVIKEEITTNFLNFKQLGGGGAKNTYKLRLKPIKKDREALESVMSDEYQETHKNSKIIQNYKFFLDELQKEQPKILDAIYMTMNKLEIANISLDPKNDNPQVIFESINSTGKSLDDMDLIRNFLLMDKEPTIQEDLYKNYIAKLEDTLGNENNLSKFIEAYLRVYYGLQVKRKRIYEIFKQLFREEFQNHTQKALQDLLKYAKIYQVITNNEKVLFNDPYDNPKQKDALCDKFGMLQTLQFGVALPFVMRLCNDFQNKVLDFTNFNNMLNILVAHNVRRSICKLESNALANTLYELYDRLKKTDGINATSLAKYLAKKSGKESFPSNTMLEKDFINVNAYSLKKIIQFVLYHIELSTNKECIESNNLTIEHFYPQTPTKEWQKDLQNDEIEQLKEYKHTFGNLTLSAINSQLGNKSMQEKIQILKQNGSLHLNQYFWDKTSWGLNDIQERSKELYNKFIDIEIFKDLPQEYRRHTTLTLESDLIESSIKSLILPNGETKIVKNFDDVAKSVIDYLVQNHNNEFYDFIQSPTPKYITSSYDTKKSKQSFFSIIDENYAFFTNDIMRDIKKLIEGCDLECSSFEIILKS